MRRWLFAACLSLPGLAWADECKLAQVSRLTLQPSPEGFLVQAMFNDKPASLIFDTGSFTSILTQKAVARLGLPVARAEEFNAVTGTLGGIGGSRNWIAVTAQRVELGGLHAKNYNFLAADVVPPPADGLLSADLISQFDIDLDFPEQQVVLYRPLGDCSAPAAFLSSPLYAVPLRPFGEDRRPRVMVTIGGKDVVAMIDTGAGRTAIFRHAAERLGLRMDDLAADPRSTVSGVGPRSVMAVRHVFEPVSVGDLTFEHMKVDVLDDRRGDEVEMLLGADFQQAVHLWISYSSHTLIMQFPPRPSKKVGVPQKP